MRLPLPFALCLLACGSAGQIPSATQPFATVIATGDAPAEALAVDGANVYWTTGAAVLQCAKSGCATPTVLEAGMDAKQWLAVDSTAVDWITSNGSAVARCTIGGCIAPSASPYVNVWDIAAAAPGAMWNAGSYVIDATHVYWVDGRNVFTCPIGSCSSRAGALVGRGVLTDTGAGPQIAVDAQAVYWHDMSGDIVRCAKSGCVAPTLVAQIPGVTVSAIASDGANVYWVAQGAIARAPVDGSAPPTTLFAGDVSHLALDADAVYFTAGTRVMRIAK